MAAGIIFEYGALSPEPTPLPLIEILAMSITIRGYIMFEVSKDPRGSPRPQSSSSGLESGKLKPVIAKTFPLEKIVEAPLMESTSKSGRTYRQVERICTAVGGAAPDGPRRNCVPAAA